MKSEQTEAYILSFEKIYADPYLNTVVNKFKWSREGI